MDIKLLCCLYWNLYSLIFIEQSLLSAAINTDGSRSNNRTANNESQIATIIFAGDIYFDGPVKYFADVVKSCDYLMPFRMTRALLAEADLRVGNLESAFLDDNLKLKPIFANKNVHHRGSVKGAEGLKYAGFDIMQLANNHISDYGEAGVVNTVKVLQDAGIDYVGLCETYPKHRIHRNDSLRDVDRVQLGNSSWHNRNKRTGKTLKSSNFTNKKDILKIKGRGKGLKERQEPFENKNSHDYDKRARKTWKSSGSVKKKEVLRITRKGNKAHDRQKPVIKTVNGVKIGFLAYCQNQEGCGSQRCSDAEGCQAGSKHFNIGPAIFDKFIASKDLIELKESVDIAIVLMHWSRELAPVPPMGVREIAKSLVLYGADLIVGTHPHVIQGHECIKKSFAIYSLGNFLLPKTGVPVIQEKFLAENKANKSDAVKYLEDMKDVFNPSQLAQMFKITVTKKGIVYAGYIPLEIKTEPFTNCLQPIPLTTKWQTACVEDDLYCYDFRNVYAFAPEMLEEQLAAGSEKSRSCINSL